MNKQFQQVVEATVEQVEILRVCISSEGKFYVPNEKDGKLSLLTDSVRSRIADFAREFAGRMESSDRKSRKSRTMTRAHESTKKRKRG